MQKPLIALVAMVKNEAKSMRRIVESCRDTVDAIVVLDTGSTDGTQKIAAEAAGELPFFLHEEPFFDFSTTRNRALALAEDKAVFSLMLSGDEELVDANGSLRAFCEQRRDATDHAYAVYIDTIDMQFPSGRLTRAGAGAYYAGVVHEALNPPATIAVPNVRIVHAGFDPERKRLRYYRDLELLREFCRKNPTATRESFYLAQTLECLGFNQQALAEYDRRASMKNGWREEAYVSMFRAARCAMICGEGWESVQHRYLEAHALFPHRAEPLYELAQFWWNHGNHANCWLFASRGANLPEPGVSALFVESSVYRWKLADLAARCGFYIGQMEEGERFARKALAGNPEAAHLARNLDFYLKARGETDQTAG